jgi:hypothetical protein
LDPAGFTHLLSIEFTADGKVAVIMTIHLPPGRIGKSCWIFPSLSRRRWMTKTRFNLRGQRWRARRFRFFYGRFTDGTFTLLSEVEPNLIGYEIPFS